MRRPSDLASRRYLALIAMYALFTALPSFDRLSLSELQPGFPSVNHGHRSGKAFHNRSKELRWANTVLAAMRTRFGVNAVLAQAEALDGTTGDEMLGDDGLSVFRVDVAVPDGIRVDHHGGPVLALIETAGLVDAHPAGESRLLDQLLQAGVQIAFPIAGAGRAWRLRRANVVANEDVALEPGHGQSS